MSEVQPEEQAVALHRSALVFDGHCDTVLRILDGKCRFVERANVVFTFLTEPREAATLEHVLNQIDYMVGLVGPEHVGLGSDFDGIRHPPAGLEDVSRMGAITQGLLARGYAEEDIRKILGLNWLRVFREAVG